MGPLVPCWRMASDQADRWTPDQVRGDGKSKPHGLRTTGQPDRGVFWMMTDPLFLLALALIVDLIVGDPPWLRRRLGHPVVWMGGLVRVLERHWNCHRYGRTARRLLGVALLACLMLVTGGLALVAERVLSALPFGWIGIVVLIAWLLAQRGLADHVAAVARALKDGGLAAGRTAVGHIVGRDVATLDQAGVCRAAVESLAENASDGVIAPALWAAVFGLPGIAVYKAINTADSMIGHRDDRHRAFGWAAARADDVANLIPARLTALMIVLAATTPGPWSARRALRTAFRDARHHRSPNAGWPEAAMAGALGLKLGGPRAYGTEAVDGIWLGNGRADATADDIDRALRLAVRGGVLFLLAVIGLAGLLGGWIG